MAISFQIPFELPSPKPETVVMVPISNWDRLIFRIGSQDEMNPLLHTVMGIFAGIAVTALFSFISLPETNHTWPMPLLGQGVLGVVIISCLASILCF
jgi:hypothetical protein